MYRCTVRKPLLTPLIAASFLAGCGAGDEAPPAPQPLAAEFVGSAACTACHSAEHAAWTGSPHDLAMQPATADTVLGDFAGATFTRDGVTTTFDRDMDAFTVTTDGPDGQLQAYRVAYTFGFAPLQQYLLEAPDGRLQAFNIAWDTRPAEAGGRRWFDLQPDESLTPGDPLHWTGTAQNWNGTCAECHSTDLDKRYDVEADRYATTWTDVDVGCESCHGPGSNHAAAPADVAPVLTATARAWVRAEDEPIAHRVPDTHAETEIEACAACHSRRTQLTDAHVPGQPFLDAFRPAFLVDPLYHADGQIRDEVFVYGSFLQSRMHAAGVTCTDCHEAHGTRLVAEGNALCATCHAPAQFDTPDHHRHGTAGATMECVSCHMRAETYMVVDPRRDHSFRVPRPDLSVELGTPNACNDCHEESAAWAAERVAEWYPRGRTGSFHYGQALAAARRWSADRGPLLRRVIDDAEMPAIVRGTAVGLLAEQVDTAAIDGLRIAVESGEPLVELAALEALSGLPPELGVDLGQRFLTSRLRALRVAAAEALLPARAGLSPSRQADLDAAVEELRSSQTFNADRAEGLLNRANLEAALGRTEAAAATLRMAIERHPAYPATYVNLADLERQLGRETEAESVLRNGLRAVPDDPALTHSLGLALVRTDRPEDALPELRRATLLDPDNPRYAYVYGVALNSLGSPGEARATLGEAHERFPGYAPILVALATMHRDAGELGAARDYARRLIELSPADPTAQALAAELGL